MNDDTKQLLINWASVLIILFTIGGCCAFGTHCRTKVILKKLEVGR